jgi:23S rRNA pseudouridine1911/1915/1917 synthase
METRVNPASKNPGAVADEHGAMEPVDHLDEADDFDAGSSDLSPISLRLDADSLGVRLDKALSTLLPQYSRGRLQQWIEDGRVTVDGKPAKSKTTMLGDEIIVVHPQPAESEHAFVPEPVPLDVVHEDAVLVVIHKPVGLVVHPAAGNWSGTLLNGLLHRWPHLVGVPRAGIVHRLDKDTSGLLVVAKTLTAQTDLVRQLQQRSMGREYLALVWGQPVSSGRIEAAIARHPRERTKMAVSQSLLAKPAVTHYRKVANGTLDGKPVALLRCQLETGRTHQIRVHLQSIGYPLVGDAVYGKQHLVHLFSRQALHAERLALVHPESGDEVEWHAPLPEDFAGLLESAGIRL